MNDRRGIIIALVTLLGAAAPGWSSFATRGKIPLSASATVTTRTPLQIVASPLSSEAFFGKNVVIPIKVVSPSINPAGLQVRIVYSLYDKGGNSVGLGTVGVPITLTRDPNHTDTLTGSAIIARSDLTPIQQGGRMDYMFQAVQNGAGSVLGLHGPALGPGIPLTTLPDPYITAIIDHVCSAVGPTGARVSAPDLSLSDGQTSVSLAPGTVASPDTLCIKAENAGAWPLGPGGSKAISVYTITLQNTTLSRPAELVLNYPSDNAGKVIDLGADPQTLGIYWLDQTNGSSLSGQWRPVSRASIDTTRHTLTGTTSHLSTFGLFAAGAVGAPGLRPSERIITPNGDGINDSARFDGVDGQIHVFDVRGRRIKTISSGATAVWDGTDDSGHIVESGVYLYQYTSQGERVSGVIGVAK